MNLLESVVDYIKNLQSGNNAKSPEGVCPNCWGQQEYDNVVRDLVKDHQIDVNAGRENYAFIQEFVVNHVDGIKLKSSVDGLVCNICKDKA